MSAMMTQLKMFSCQVCAPSDWTDEQIREFAEAEYPCGNRVRLDHPKGPRTPRGRPRTSALRRKRQLHPRNVGRLI